MTSNSSPVLALIAQQIAEVYRPIIKAAGEALRKVAEVLDEIRETHEQTPEQKRGCTYEHLVNRPHDHIHSRVAHTSSKPPRPHTIYRRRTP